jgi:3-methyladenine DNA glycosylase Mpg
VKVLDSTFFDRPAEKVAYDLIGCRLNWAHRDKPESRIITKIEAYTGRDDLASHASRGRTERNEAMFGPSGTFYVYFVYGMHWMLNVVTGPAGYPAAVLIRSVEGIQGPGRLTKTLASAVPFNVGFCLAPIEGSNGTFQSPTREKETMREALPNGEASAAMPHRMLRTIRRPRQ